MLKVQPDFFLLLIVKHERRDKLRGIFTSKNEPQLGHLENSQCWLNVLHLDLKMGDNSHSSGFALSPFSDDCD